MKSSHTHRATTLADATSRLKASPDGPRARGRHDPASDHEVRSCATEPISSTSLAHRVARHQALAIGSPSGR